MINDPIWSDNVNKQNPGYLQCRTRNASISYNDFPGPVIIRISMKSQNPVIDPGCFT